MSTRHNGKLHKFTDLSSGAIRAILVTTDERFAITGTPLNSSLVHAQKQLGARQIMTPSPETGNI